jgi:site-specific DNA-methyltransferase (adenine-specific)
MNEISSRLLNTDCRLAISTLEPNSIHLCLSDIPYGINLDEWDVLHNNTNSALLGQSPAQRGKSGFKRRGKPINGWNEADKKSGKEYEDWCSTWTSLLYPVMKKGASVFLFCARRTMHHVINSMEDSGFLLRDILAWKKPIAHHRAQRLSGVLAGRELSEQAKKWEGWRLGNLSPVYEPITWFFKPYDYTITDNVLENEVGALNIDNNLVNGERPSNILDFWFEKGEKEYHEAQKPISLLKFLINLTTRENHIVLDPFMGSGSTCVAAKLTNRKYIGIELDGKYFNIANKRLESLNFTYEQREKRAVQLTIFEKQ